MALTDHPDFGRMLIRISNSMLLGIDIEVPPYMEELVDRSREILILLAEDIDKILDESSATELVKATVVKLNQPG